ncbi:MAG: FAD-dependent oxidoreductase [Akkermansiaceae bacterium]
MTEEGRKWTIVGQGLAGTCLAWALWERGEGFRVIDRGTGGSSRVAAGMVNPITGKNFQPSWRIAEFLPQAIELYARVEERIGRKIWHPFPVLRLAGSEKEWAKIVSKLGEPAVAPWVAGEVAAPPGWVGGVHVRGGARLDTQAFMEGSRQFFQDLGCCQIGEATGRGPDRIWCDGSAGLMGGQFGPHRCAKGEILTVHAPTWDDLQIRIGAGGWLVPVGEARFKIGSTYEWNELNEIPTEQGLRRVREIAARLGGGDYEIILHDAGVRPILRCSQPLIGRLPGGGWMFNALGSKGSLYAPGMAQRLADWLVDGIVPEPEVDLRVFLQQNP